MTLEERRARIKDAGLRVTAPRLAVLDVLHAHPHATADMVVTAVEEKLGSISKQAIYDALAAFTQAGLLRRQVVEGGALAAFTQAGLLRRQVVEGGGARYEIERGDNHHHLWCESCGKYQDVECALRQPPCLYPVDDHGFAIRMADIVYRGICPDCQKTAEQNL